MKFEISNSINLKYILDNNLSYTFGFIYNSVSKKYLDKDYNETEQENAQLFNSTKIDYSKLINLDILFLNTINTSQLIYYATDIHNNIYGCTNYDFLKDFENELISTLTKELINLKFKVSVEKEEQYTELPFVSSIKLDIYYGINTTDILHKSLNIKFIPNQLIYIL